MSDAAVAQRAKPAKPSRNEPTPTLKPSGFLGSEFARANFDAVMSAEHDFEDALRPGYWTNVVGLLKKNPISGERSRTGALINIGTEDHAFFGHLYVRAVLEQGLVVQCIGPSFNPKTGKACPIDLQTGQYWQGRKATDLGTAFEIKWNVGKGGFDVIRTSDRQIVIDGTKLPTREFAEAEIAKILRSS